MAPPANVVADDSPARRGGRPRSSAAELAILQATRELLVEGGVQKLTVEGVAARAGVAKTTIYRRWRDKDELALAVVLDMVERVVELPELGDTRAELLAFVGAAVEVLGSTLMGRVMQGLVSDLATDPELGGRVPRARRERARRRGRAPGRPRHRARRPARGTPIPRRRTTSSSAPSTTACC